MLAACAQLPDAPTSQPITTQQDPAAYQKFITNQRALAKILTFNIKGQVGILNSKERYSTTFSYLNYSPSYYAISMDVPYSAKQIGISRSGQNYIYSRDGKSYYANDPAKFSQAVFGFEIPIAKLTDLVLGRPFVDNYDYRLGNANVKVEDGLVTEQHYQGITVKYSDYRLIGKYYLPYQIDITRLTDRVKIKAFDKEYKIITEAKDELNLPGLN